MTRCCVAIVLCVAACSAQVRALPWWKTASLYQVYPRSFKDTNGDGVGDLKGITQNAAYFKEIGVDGIWMNPIFQSPMVDNGYDISNFTAIDPTFGTMADFEELIQRFKELGLKILLDFVPNHTSDQHEWFQKSVINQTDYRDFYVWKDPKGFVNGTPVPPNNWLGLFGGSMWEWREERQQFYLHQFSVKQPDLNYRCPEVWGNVTNVMKFWIDKGVDGFRMDAVKHIYENESFPDEFPIPGTAGNTFETQDHSYQQNQPETYGLSNYWGSFVNGQNHADGIERMLLIEVYDTVQNLMEYYMNDNGSLVIPFNFNLLSYGAQGCRAADMKGMIDAWMDVMPENQTASWVIGNHDNLRIADRYGTEMVDSMNMLTAVLPGIRVSYYGEEIGMQDTYLRLDQIVDQLGLRLTPIIVRDVSRTPMQWDDSPSAGFSTNSTPWLPANPNYWWLNVDAQRKAKTSHLKVFQAISKARKDPVLQRGDLKVLAPNNDTLIVVRSYSGSYYVFLLNMASEVVTYTTASLFGPNNLDIDMSVVAATVNSGLASGLAMRKGAHMLTLRPKAAVLLMSSSSVIYRLSVMASLVMFLAAFLK